MAANQITLIAPMPPWTDGYLHVMSLYQHDPWKFEAPDWSEHQPNFPWFDSDSNGIVYEKGYQSHQMLTMETLYYMNASSNTFDSYLQALSEISYWTEFSFHVNDAYKEYSPNESTTGQGFDIGHLADACMYVR